MATRYILLEDGTNRILLEDGVNLLLKDDLVAQVPDDVLLRLGPGLTATTGSGLMAPVFTASGGGVTPSSGGMYYQMMQNWFEAA